MLSKVSCVYKGKLQQVFLLQWYFTKNKDNSVRRENFAARSCSGPTSLRKIKANTLMKFVLTDHHILILKVLKIFSRIKFTVPSSPKLYSSFKTQVECNLLGKPFQNLPGWRRHLLCSQELLYKGALRTST